MQELMDFNKGWKFHFGDIVSIRNRWALAKSGSFNQGPESRDYDDSDWEDVTIPHDFVFETKPYPYSEKEFGEDNTIPAMEDVNNIHTTAGSFDKNVGWYRKHFFIPKEYEGKKLFLIFGGIYRDSTFFLNEFFLDNEKSGYSKIEIDITDTAVYGGDNILSIRCDARQAEGWFYEGGGIYRDAYLKVVEKEYIDELFVYAKPCGKSSDKAILNISLKIYGCGNKGSDRSIPDFSDHKLTFKIYDNNNFLVKEDIVKLSDIYNKDINSNNINNTKNHIYDSDNCVINDNTESNGIYIINNNSDITDVITDISVGVSSDYAPVLFYSQTDGSYIFSYRLILDNPRLWSVDKPFIYQFVVSLINGEEIRNKSSVNFGIRKSCFDNNKGFILNGERLRIKGVCCHQNLGGLGNAVPKEVMRYRIKKLKEMGANGYRGAHYPLSEEFLTICDQEGMLVMLETRLLSSARPDMDELTKMVKLGRNHPSVIMYSIGNEEASSQATEQGARIASTMIEHIKRLDPYRPVTMALLMLDMKTNEVITDYKVLEKISDQLDVAGYNYHSDLYEKFHKEYPDKPFISTEMGTFKSTRGCYKTDKSKCHLAVTDKSPYYMYGAQRWRDCMPDWISGLFIWTGFDYYGEPTPFAWPAISSQFGAMDLCGYPKDFYYFYKAWWTNENIVHVYPDMNQEPGIETDYYVFSNADEVELILNGKSLGIKEMPKDDYLVWEKIVSEKGVMEAVGYKDGAVVMRTVNKTCDEESAEIVVTEDYRENDIVIRKIALLDKEGNLVTGKDVRFDIPSKWGEILGASNGDPSDHTPSKCGYVNTFHGLAQVITATVHFS